MFTEPRSSLEKAVLSFIHRPWKDISRSESEFNGLALRIFHFQYQNNSIYRRFCDIEGYSVFKINSWKKIPAMPSLAFKELKVTSFPKKEAIKVFRTSGTTREGRGVHYFRTLKLYEASILPPFEKAFFWDRAKLSYYFLMNSPVDDAGSSLSHMMGVVNRRFADGRGQFYIKKGKPAFESLLKELQKEKKSVFLLATAFSLKSFLDYLKNKKIYLRLPVGSRLMETGGFKGKVKSVTKKALYTECGKFLGIPKKNGVSEYGMTELSSQYYARALGPMANPAWMRFQLIDPQTGLEVLSRKPGILKHVDLANLDSVIAIQTEDLARKRGQGFELLGRLPGSAVRGCSLSYEELMGEFE